MRVTGIEGVTDPTITRRTRLRRTPERLSIPRDPGS